MIVTGTYPCSPGSTALLAPPSAPSPAYSEGRNDAASGEPMAVGCSPAYAMGYNDFMDEQRTAN